MRYHRTPQNQRTTYRQYDEEGRIILVVTPLKDKNIEVDIDKTNGEIRIIDTESKTCELVVKVDGDWFEQDDITQQERLNDMKEVAKKHREQMIRNMHLVDDAEVKRNNKE